MCTDVSWLNSHRAGQILGKDKLYLPVSHYTGIMAIFYPLQTGILDMSCRKHVCPGDTTWHVDLTGQGGGDREESSNLFAESRALAGRRHFIKDRFSDCCFRPTHVAVSFPGITTSSIKKNRPLMCCAHGEGRLKQRLETEDKATHLLLLIRSEVWKETES